MLLAVLLISRGPNSMDGDVPHYLAVTDSLVHDFDLDLTNQYQPDTRYLFYPGEPGGHVRPGRGGALYPYHYIGLSIALVPVYFAAEQAALALPDSFLEAVRWDRARACRDLLSLAVALLYAAAAVLTLRATRRILEPHGPSDGSGEHETGLSTGVGVSLIATALAFGTPPLLGMSILAFTEVPAAFLCAWFLYERLRTPQRAQIQLLSLALLPWLHVRYAVVAVAGFIWMLAEMSRGGESLSKKAASYLLLPVLSAVLLSASGWWMFGSLLPVGQFDTGFGLSPATWGAGLAGLLVDRHFGLLAVAPFWLVTLAGIGPLINSRPGYIGFAAVSFLGTWVIAAVNTMWWGGYCPPARLIIPVMPLLVPLLAAGLRALRWSVVRWLVYLMVAWSASMTALLLLEPVRLWSDTQKGSGLVSALPLVPRIFPDLADKAVPWLHVATALTVMATLAALLVFAGRTGDDRDSGPLVEG